MVGTAQARLCPRYASLSHLALGLGGVFRIDFADDAVAAIALGGIEADIGAFDKAVGIVGRIEHGHANGAGDAAENLAGGSLPSFLGHHGTADVIGDSPCLP